VSFSRTAVFLTLSGGVAACAIHPVPQNVTGVTTDQIVHRIRCEARASVIDVAHHLRPENLLTLQSIGIVYSFQLTMTEANNYDLNSTFERMISNGSQTINPALSDHLMRQNMRAFTVADTYATLTQMDQKKCNDEPTGPNYQYPIVGRIGIDETISQFVKLALNDGLTGTVTGNAGSSSDIDSVTGARTLVDTLTFTTALSAGATPTIMISPVTAAAQLSMASLGLAFTRTDAHQVVVGLGIAPPEKSTKTGTHGTAVNFAFPLVVSPPTSSNSNAGVTAALQAVSNQILRSELARPLLLAP
jgi:hypothetical protein